MNMQETKQVSGVTSEQFDAIVAEQLKRCTDILCSKAKEYATTDRLHNFKMAAKLQDETPFQSLAGMMAKHTISVYDMLRTDAEKHSLDLWNEKITDSINYLLLLAAMVRDESSKGWGA